MLLFFPFFFNIYFPSVPYSLSRFFSISLFPSSLLSPLLTSFSQSTFQHYLPSSLTLPLPFCGPPSSCPPPGLLPRWPNAMPPHRSAHPGPKAGRAEWRGRGSAVGAGGEGLGEGGELGVVVLAAMQSAPPCHRTAPAAVSSYTDLVLASLQGTSIPLLP